METFKKRLYFDSAGLVFFTVDLYSESPISKDVEEFKVLSERNRDSFDVLELEYGQYAQDFAECNGYRVNPETKELEFSYPDPNEPEAPPVFQEPLTKQIEQLDKRQLETENAVLMLMDMNLL